MLNFLWFALGAGALLVALALTALLMRLRRTLRVLEEVLLTANEEMTETLPELRDSLENVNQITAGVNTALQVGGAAAVSSSRSLRAGIYGLGIGVRSLWRSYGAEPQSKIGGGPGGGS